MLRQILDLITRGRASDAKRVWEEALDTFNPDVQSYESLHLPVARLLLHRGLVDFSEKVMDTVPQEVKMSNPKWVALMRHLKALQQARRTGCVFPLCIRPEDWWSGPHLVEESVSRWIPARVDEIDERAVYLLAAQPPRNKEEDPLYGSIEIPITDFNRWSGEPVTPGSFIELVWFNDEEEPTIKTHPDVVWEDPNLPSLPVDPLQYLHGVE